MSERQKIICIVGPTASGKTDLGVSLAKELDGEIISADSMQVYKNMPIASAVPSNEEKHGINHRLMEFLEPTHQLTVAEYVDLAKKEIQDVISLGKQPIIVGGTGLYIDSLINNIVFLEEDDNKTVREKYEKMYDLLGGTEMLNRLSLFDSISANRIKPNDKKRLVRAFEIYENTGVSMSKQYEISRQEPSQYDYIIIGIGFNDRQKLYDRINLRVDIMIKNGLIDEAKMSYENYKELKGGYQAIGHKELFPYFEGEITLEEAVESLKQQTRRYAKRQLTWFRKNQNINWIYKDKTDDVSDNALKILERQGIVCEKIKH